jgi:hypothetical protein
VKNPRMALVEAAITQIGVRETSRNAGPELVKYWDATSYPNGDEDRQPWCAAFVAWVIFEAMKWQPLLALGDKTRPRSAAVKDWVPWALKPSNGCVVFGPSDPKYKPEPGDIVVFTFSHIGIVERFDGWSKGLQTIEGNTDDEGSREGVKVCRRTRPASQCKSFIRLAAKATRARRAKA